MIRTLARFVTGLSGIITNKLAIYRELLTLSSELLGIVCV